MIRVIDLDWPETELSPLKETVIVATICGQVLEHKQRPPREPAIPLQPPMTSAVDTVR